MAHPGQGVPVFTFARELLEVNLQGKKTVHRCVESRRTPPRSELLEHPLDIAATFLFGGNALLLNFFQVGPPLFFPLLYHLEHNHGSGVHSSVFLPLYL